MKKTHFEKIDVFFLTWYFTHCKILYNIDALYHFHWNLQFFESVSKNLPALTTAIVENSIQSMNRRFGTLKRVNLWWLWWWLWFDFDVWWLLDGVIVATLKSSGMSLESFSQLCQAQLLGCSCAGWIFIYSKIWAGLMNEQ